MTTHYLVHDVTISGEHFRTLASAAHAVRQYAIDHDDFHGWKLSREMREADTVSLAVLAKQKLGVWLAHTYAV
jgi:hypothetical protein